MSKIDIERRYARVKKEFIPKTNIERETMANMKLKHKNTKIV
jgi:hypothetical protein